MNKDRSLQIKENQLRKLNNLVKDAEIDESILEKLELEKKRQNEIENQKKLEKINSKYVIQNQIKDKEILKEESKQEYIRDKRMFDEAVKKLIIEDMEAQRENQFKKELNKKYMYEAYEEKERRNKEQIAQEKLEREKDKQYYAEVARRDKELQMKKAAVKEEKDKIFDKLAAEENKRQAEKEYWENVRNELYSEEMERREKIKELELKEKRQR
jgi:inner centromere protein